MEKQVKCPHCKSIKAIKRGLRKTQNRGLIQRFSCKDCNKRFVVDEGFFKMKNNPKKVTLCLDLFYRGVSTRKIQEHLQAFYPHNSSNVSIYRWVVKYSNMISKYTDDLKLETGKEVQLDEMECHRKGRKNWFIDSIDTKTRFMVTSQFFKNRSQTEVKEVVKRLKYKTEGKTQMITTDSFRTYKKVIKQTYGYDKKLRQYNVIHREVNASKGEGFNIPIERLHNSVRERTKIFRGFHGSVESANSIMKGYEIFYNFCRKHQAIRKYPYQLALPELELGLNKWLDLITISKKNLRGHL